MKVRVQEPWGSKRIEYAGEIVDVLEDAYMIKVDEESRDNTQLRLLLSLSPHLSFDLWPVRKDWCVTYGSD